MKIGVVGCGWIGFPLAEKLSTRHEIIGTTTSRGKLSMLEKSGIHAERLEIGTHKVRLSEDLAGVDLLIVTLPPNRPSDSTIDTYGRQIDFLLDAFRRQGNLRHVIYTSSTGVYPNDNEEVTEEMISPGEKTRVNELRDTAQAVRMAERTIAESGLTYTIVRLAGLYGPGREPGRFFAGRKDVAGPQAPVNLVHRDDVIAVLQTMVEAVEKGGARVQNEIFNVCADAHPSRSEFYTRAAQAMGAEPPTFHASEVVPYKIVSNQKLKGVVDYQFIHPDPLQDMKPNV